MGMGYAGFQDLAAIYENNSGQAYWRHELSYKSLSRSATQVNYEITIVSQIIGPVGATANYKLDYSIVLNGQTFTGSLKADTSTVFVSFPITTTFTAQVPVGSNTEFILGSFRTIRPDFASQDGLVDSGTRSLALGRYETVPSWTAGSTVTVSPNGIIPENTTTVTISWPAATDAEYDTVYYTVKRYVNGSYDRVVANNTTALSVVDYIGEGNQGTQYDYYVTVSDGMLTGATLIGGGPTKNLLSISSASVSKAIQYTTTSIAVSFSGATNTHTNKAFTYKLTCNDGFVPIYNSAKLSNANFSFGIIRTGETVPTTYPYVKFEDLKALVKDTKYQGTIKLTITATNAFGTPISYSFAVNLDLRYTATYNGTVTIANGIKISRTEPMLGVVETYTLLPALKPVYISWSALTDPLGDTPMYDIYRDLGKGDEYVATVADLNYTDTFTLNYDTSIRYHIVAKTTYSSYDIYSATKNIYAYKSPLLTITKYNKSMTDFSISWNMQCSTTPEKDSRGYDAYNYIYSMKYRINGGAWVSWANNADGRSYMPSYTVTQNQSAAIACTIEVVIQDYISYSLGLPVITAIVTMPAINTPLSVRELGVGIYTIPDGSYKFSVGVNSKIDGSLLVTGAVTMNNSLSANGLTLGAGGATINNGNVTVGGNITAYATATTIGGIKGYIQTEASVTSNRPTVDMLSASGLGAGTMYFDTTLKRPIWWDGTKWIKADGTNA